MGLCTPGRKAVRADKYLSTLEKLSGVNVCMGSNSLFDTFLIKKSEVLKKNMNTEKKTKIISDRKTVFLLESILRIKYEKKTKAEITAVVEKEVITDANRNHPIRFLPK